MVSDVVVKVPFLLLMFYLENSKLCLHFRQRFSMTIKVKWKSLG